MKPLDPRLVRTTRAVRVHLAVTVACGVAVTGLILLQAWLVARAIANAPLLDGDGTWVDVGGAVALVGVVALVRAGLAYGAETAALRSAAAVKSQLRRRLVAHVTGPGADPATLDPGELATLATRGLDALDDYVARYLPQLVLAVLVPVAVLVVVLDADWLSALIIALTLPLIPVFMALVGWQAQDYTRKQWHLLSRLGGHFLDAVEGLPTLAIFRRAKAEVALIRRTSEAHREATMRSLRIAFLSALVLELLATLSVALVAVQIGVRLLYGQLDLETALLVLILAPEAYLPLREVGARFHASMEGVAAAEQVFAVLERPGRVRRRSRTAAPRARRAAGLRFEGVRLTHPSRVVPALDGVDLAVPAGRTLLLTGTSGAGKSTLLSVLLRFADADEGRITVDGVDLRDLPVDEWRRRIAWLPQRPYLFDASVADNVRLGVPGADDEAVARAVALAEATDVVAALPDGLATRLGERGTRLSAGQRQRIALARAFLRRLDGATLVLLDEPTAHLDPDNAAAVRAGVARLLDGATGIVVAHDAGWADLADEVVRLEAGHLEARDRSPGTRHDLVRRRPERPSDRFRRRAVVRARPAAADARAGPAPRRAVRSRRARRSDRHRVRRRAAVGLGVAHRDGRDAAAAHPAQHRDRRDAGARHPARGQPLPGAADHARRRAAHPRRRARPRLRPARAHRTGAPVPVRRPRDAARQRHRRDPGPPGARPRTTPGGAGRRRGGRGALHRAARAGRRAARGGAAARRGRRAARGRPREPWPGPPGDRGARGALDRADRHRARRAGPARLRRDGPGRGPGRRHRRRADPGGPPRRGAARAGHRRVRADRRADAVGHAAARRRRGARRGARRRPAGRAGADRAGRVRDRRAAAGGRGPARHGARRGRAAVRPAGRAPRRPGRAKAAPERSERGVG